MRATLLLLSILLLPLAAQTPERAGFAVVHKLGGAVGFYTASGKFLSSVPVGKHPHELLLSRDGRTLYVSDNGMVWMTDPGEGENTISIIDVATRRKTGVINLGSNRRPHGMDLVPGHNQLVVTIENPDGGLLLVDLDQRRVLRRFDVKGGKPHMVSVDRRAEFAYVSNDATDTVAVLRLRDGEVKLVPMGRRPQGGAFSPDGKLYYVTNVVAEQIVVLDTATHQIVRRMPAPGGPARIAVTPDGKTLVYNRQPVKGAAIADAATGRVLASLTLPGTPLSLTMSPDGKFAYAGLQDTDKIAVIDVAARTISRIIETPSGAGPDPVLPLP